LAVGVALALNEAGPLAAIAQSLLRNEGRRALKSLREESGAAAL
jgi:hypothetical protein